MDHLPIDGRPMARYQRKKRWGKRTTNVPFDVRPGSEMSFEFGQVGHYDLSFAYMRRQWRGRSLVFGSMFGLCPQARPSSRVQFEVSYLEYSPCAIHVSGKDQNIPWQEYDRLLAINQMNWVDFNHVAALNRPFDRCNASCVQHTRRK